MGPTRNHRRFAYEVLQSQDRVANVRVKGHCMEPIVKDGDRVSFQKSRLYLPGDLVAALLPDGKAVAHRVVGYVFRGPVPCLVLKADTADTEDPLVPLNQVLGKLEGFVPSMSDRMRALGFFFSASILRRVQRHPRLLPNPPLS